MWSYVSDIRVHSLYVHIIIIISYIKTHAWDNKLWKKCECFVSNTSYL